MYEMTEEKVIIDGKEYATNGIKYGELIINDVSADRGRVKRLVRDLNTYKLSPVHLYEILENFLAE